MLYQSNSLQVNQKYVEAYDKLSEKKKRRFFESKVIDWKTFSSLTHLFLYRNLGFKKYFENTMGKNDILKELFIFGLIARIILFFHFHKTKTKCIWAIVRKGYTPKGAYFRYAVLSDETLDCETEDLVRMNKS